MAAEGSTFTSDIIVSYGGYTDLSNIYLTNIQVSLKLSHYCGVKEFGVSLIPPEGSTSRLFDSNALTTSSTNFDVIFDDTATNYVDDISDSNCGQCLVKPVRDDMNFDVLWYQSINPIGTWSMFVKLVN